MRVAAKFTLALLSALICAFFVYGWRDARRQVAGYEADRIRDHDVMTRTLAPALGHTWNARGEGAVIDAIASTDVRSEERVRWVSLEPDPPKERAPDVAVPQPLGKEPWHTILERDNKRVLYTYFRVDGAHGEQRAIEIMQDLEREQVLVREAIKDELLALLALVLVAVAAATVLGVTIVGKPIETLMQQARRIGAGDLGTRLRLQGNDEIAELGREMDAMADALLLARQRVAEETEARVAAVEQLRHGERLITVGRLASGMAHELGTPLNVVGMRAKMIAQGEIEGEEARDSGRIIAEQAARITRIMRQLLDFARRREPQKERIDLRAVAGRVVAFVQPVADKAGVHLALTSGPPVWLDADGAQLEQVLTNLVMNAIQSIPEEAGGKVEVDVVLGAKPKDPAAAQGEYACVLVSDTGTGISEEDKLRIFEPFFTTKEVGRGTGLGLSVAYGIVREHGGFIDVESEVGKGSTFRVFLPTGAGEAAAEECS
jgi:signal transduction histidine kinase